MEILAMALGAYQTNCYIVCGENDQCVVIDPGYQPERVLQQLARLGKKVAAIFLTHGHFDHVGGVKQIAAETDCPVYLCEAELALPEMITDGPLYYTHTYGEGDSLCVAGLNFRILHTPGHTPGGVCILCEDTLFSGDTLFAGSIGRTDFPGGSWEVLKKSLARLAGLETDYRVLPGHGEATTLSYEKKTNPYLR